MQQISMQVFNQRYLESETPAGSPATATTAESQPVNVSGNQVTMFITVINGEGGIDSLTFTLQGSYDGNTWYTPASSTITSLTSLGSKPLTISSWPYPFARVMAELTDDNTTPAKVIFSAWLTNASQ